MLPPLTAHVRATLAAALNGGAQNGGVQAAASVAARLAFVGRSHTAAATLDQDLYVLHTTNDIANDTAADNDAATAAAVGAPVTSVVARGRARVVRVDPSWLVHTVLDRMRALGGPSMPEAPNAPAQRVLIEFSSPNIAKPFHVGHLRSTILGGFLARLHTLAGHPVTRINYLGDWGKQFGLLGVGAARYGDPALLEARPLQHLYDVYVRINRDAETDPAVHAQARAHAKALLTDPAKRAEWAHFRALSVTAYAKLYARLGVVFDDYSGESQYVAASADVAALLAAHRSTQQAAHDGALVQVQRNGALVADLTPYGLGTAVIVKEDGETLYLTRDIAAAQERFRRTAFARLVYVAGMEQSLHFKQLFKLLEITGHPWHERCVHAGFGLIRGMKTRLGTAVFLEDLLDEAKSYMHDILTNNENCKLAPADLDAAAEILGRSAVVVQDLKARRAKDYDFAWDRVLCHEGDTGPFLQYTHARLCSVLRVNHVMSDVDSDTTNDTTVIALRCYLNNADPSLVAGDAAAVRVVVALLAYHHALETSLQHLEPSVVLTELFAVARAASAALAALPVKGATSIELSRSRALLFWAARVTLHHGLSLLGLPPLCRV